MGKRDEVKLTVPAMPEFLRLARVTAAGLASRLGFSFDEVEDLRLAIDELCYGLTGNQGREGSVVIRYLLDDDSLTIEGVGRFSTGEKMVASLRPEMSELSEVILDALVDEHRFSAGPEGPRFSMLKRRHSGVADDDTL